MGKGGGFRRLRSKARGRGTDVRAVRGWAPALLESAAHDRRLSVVPRNRLTAIKGLAEGDARRSKELTSPSCDAAELAIPEDVRDGLPALAARATHLSEHAAAVQHNAHNLRTPKHGSRYRYGRRRGRSAGVQHNARARAHDLRTQPAIHRQTMNGRKVPIVPIGPLLPVSTQQSPRALP